MRKKNLVHAAEEEILKLKRFYKPVIELHILTLLLGFCFGAVHFAAWVFGCQVPFDEGAA